MYLHLYLYLYLCLNPFKGALSAPLKEQPCPVEPLQGPTTPAQEPNLAPASKPSLGVGRPIMEPAFPWASPKVSVCVCVYKYLYIYVCTYKYLCMIMYVRTLHVHLHTYVYIYI